MSGREVEVSAYGRTAHLNVLDDDAIAAIRDRLPPEFLVRARDSGSTAEREWTADAPETLTRVLGELELWVAEWADDRVFVHAGCVAWRGHAIVVPGRSHSGKTTLTVALLRRGAAYMSDEYAVLSTNGKVHAYPRRLRIRQAAGWSPIDPAELGAGVEPGPLPVAVVARLDYAPAAQEMTRVSGARGVVEMLDNTVCARSRPQIAMDAVSASASRALVVLGRRGEADDTARRLLGLVEEQVGAS